MSNERTMSLSKRVTNMGHKIPYVDIISDAILASPNRRLTAKEIFDHVSAKFGPMKSAETLKAYEPMYETQADLGWYPTETRKSFQVPALAAVRSFQNTIRHTLSRYKIFRKVQRGKQKKPNWWTVDDDDNTDGVTDSQIEDLQREARAIARSPPTQNAGREPQEISSQHIQQQLELANDAQHQECGSPNYRSHQPLQQFPDPYYDPASQTRPAQLLMGSNRDIGIGDATYRGAYRTEQLAMIDPMIAGPSHSGIYSLPANAEPVTYLFPYQELPPPMNGVQVAPAGVGASPLSPTPQYYQM